MSSIIFDKMLIGFAQLLRFLPPQRGGITHISQKIGSEGPIF